MSNEWTVVLSPRGRRAARRERPARSRSPASTPASATVPATVPAPASAKAPATASKIMDYHFQVVDQNIRAFSSRYPVKYNVLPRGLEIKVPFTMSYEVSPGTYESVTYTTMLPAYAKLGPALLNGVEVCIVCNPFCIDDQAFCVDAQSYLYPEAVKIALPNGFFTWNVDQYTDASMDVLCHCLTQIPFTQRHDLVVVTRALSALCNSNDDDGILKGNWSGDFDGGTAPFKWTGSDQIMRIYSDKLLQPQIKDRSVEYGQCWVFAGILLTLFRSAGMCSRIVTNFGSGKNLNPRQDDIIDWASDDSVWNFHVWNEAWFCRTDMPGLYKSAGFQVLDSTPQIVSTNSLYCCGPTPVRLLKDTDIRITRKDYNIFNLDTQLFSYSDWISLLQKRYPKANIVSGRRKRRLDGFDTDFIKDQCKFMTATESDLGLTYVSTQLFTDGCKENTTLTNITSTYV